MTEDLGAVVRRAWAAYDAGDEQGFHQMRGGLIARTWAATAEAGFYTQLTGRAAPEKLDNQT